MKTWHEYDFPVDKTVHWEQLKQELRVGAAISSDPKVVTCLGCLAWIETRKSS